MGAAVVLLLLQTAAETDVAMSQPTSVPKHLSFTVEDNVPLLTARVHDEKHFSQGPTVIYTVSH